MLPVVAMIDIKGVLTGTLEVSADVDFEIEGTVTVNPQGKATANFKNPSIKHQARLLTFGLQAAFSLVCMAFQRMR